MYDGRWKQCIFVTANVLDFKHREATKGKEVMDRKGVFQTFRPSLLYDWLWGATEPETEYYLIK